MFAPPPTMMMVSTLNVKVVQYNVARVLMQPNARLAHSIVIHHQIVVAVRAITTILITCARFAHINAPHAWAHRIIVQHVPVIDKVLPNVIVLLVTRRLSIKLNAIHKHAHTNA